MEEINEFLNDLHNKNLASKNTIEFYRADLKAFYEFLENKDAINIHQEELKNYLDYIKSKYKENSQIRKITSLKSFYNYLLKKEVISVSPVEKISTSRKSVSLGEGIKDFELKSIIDACPNNTNGHRDKLIIKLLAETGVKIIDILNISLTEIESHDFKFFRVKDKNIFVVVHISEDLSREFKSYVNDFNIEFQDNLVFYNVTNQSFKNNFLKYVDMAHLERRVLPSMIKNSHTLKREKIDQDSHLEDLDLMKKIKEEYLKIRIGDDNL